MVKKTRVPAQLHAELTEYSSLLTALRTSSTLDLSNHLIAYGRRSSPLGLEERTGGGPSSSPPRNTTFHDLAVEQDDTHQAFEKDAAPLTPVDGHRDLWTRWPLLVGDVHRAEWPLDAEVEYIVGQALQSKRRISGVADDGPVDQDTCPDPDLFTLDDAYRKSLGAAAGLHLTHILSLLAAHYPLTGTNMHNRIKPICWDDVITAVSSAGKLPVEFVVSIFRRQGANYYHSAANRTVARLEATYQTLSNHGN